MTQSDPEKLAQMKADAAVLRARHQFENEQLHKRLSWLASFESLIFAAAALAWDKSPQFVDIVASLGIAISLQGMGAIYWVGIALTLIRKDWEDGKLDEVEPLGVFGAFRDLEKIPPHKTFPWPELFVPYAFSVAWSAVLCIRFQIPLRRGALPYAVAVGFLSFVLVWRRLGIKRISDPQDSDA
jgi:hypothetical protein